MKSKFIKSMTLVVIAMVLFTPSCQEKENVKPIFDNGKFRIEPVTDEKVKEEILAMANGRPIASGKTAIAPVLPPGYDYSNLEQVTIAGTNSVTYVAYSTTVNDTDMKEMVGIYYQNGVYKNYLQNRWTLIQHPSAPRIIIKYIYANAAPYYNQAYIIPSKDVVNVTKIYPPSACARSTALCVNAFFFNQGWLGLGLFLGSFQYPSIAAGAIVGCALGCAIHGPADNCPDYGLC